MLLAARVRSRAVRHLRAADPVLRKAVVGPCRLRIDTGDRFAALASSILYQQLAGKAAETIERRFHGLYGGRAPQPAELIATPDSALRGAGLSRQKISYMRDLARKTQDGLPLSTIGRLDDDGVAAALTSVRGIGRWTADMFLMFRLGRLDVLPVGDYGIQKSIQKLYRLRALPKPERMRRIAEPWRPYRTVACWYLWRFLDGGGAE